MMILTKLGVERCVQKNLDWLGFVFLIPELLISSQKLYHLLLQSGSNSSDHTNDKTSEAPRFKSQLVQVFTEYVSLFLFLNTHNLLVQNIYTV